MNRGLGEVVCRFWTVPPKCSSSLRRSRRMKRMPRTRVMRIVTDTETEIAMTAGLMKTNQPSKICYRKRLQTWIISGNRLVLLKWIVQNQVEDTRLG